MGQPISVVEKRSHDPSIVRFETNRPLTGMAHERYEASPDPLAVRPADELARRLFARGGVGAVHVNGSVVTVRLGPGSTGEGLAEVVASLFRHYPDVDTDGSTGAPAAAAPVEMEVDSDAAAPETAADPATATTRTAQDAPGSD